MDKHSRFRNERFVEFWLQPNTDYNTYTITFIGPDEILNDGTVTQLRIMPTVFPAEVDIKEIKFKE